MSETALMAAAAAATGLAVVLCCAVLRRRREGLVWRIDDKPSKVLTELEGAFANHRGFRWTTDGLMISVRSWRLPLWALGLTIITLPVGLVFLLVRREVDGQLELSGENGTTVVRACGKLPGGVVSAVKGVAVARSQLSTREGEGLT